MQTTLLNLKNLQNFPNQERSFGANQKGSKHSSPPPSPPPILIRRHRQKTRYSELMTRYFMIGNLGGGRPLAKIAASLAEPPAELTSVSPEKTIKIANIANKLPNKKR